MSRLAQEVRATQNPALGAAVMWRLAVGYHTAHRERQFVPLPISFVAIPVIFHQPLLSLIDRTRVASGLRQFVMKLGDTSEARQDLLFAIQDRADRWRDVSLESLRFALVGRLVRLELDGRLIPLTLTEPSALPTDAKRLLRNAEKLGAWCAGLSLHEIGNLLHLRF